jgi:hypothetical protein
MRRHQGADAASSAVPARRCTETRNAAPHVDCITISVDIAAQYPSGIRPPRNRRPRRILDRRWILLTSNPFHHPFCHLCSRLHLLRWDAVGHVSDEWLVRFDEVIQEASTKLKTLEELRRFAERQTGNGAALNVG